MGILIYNLIILFYSNKIIIMQFVEVYYGLYDIERSRRKWGVTPRWINYYCAAGRIPGAMKIATIWLIPKEAKKPVDGRTKQGKEQKHE